jgi:hypothetical protein
MNNKLTKFIQWATDIDNSLSKVMKKDTMLTEEERSDLLLIVKQYEKVQDQPSVEKDEFIKYMSDMPVFRFTTLTGERKYYQYASLSKRYASNIEDLVVYQGFNGEYYHWISKTVLDELLNKETKRKHIGGPSI